MRARNILSGLTLSGSALLVLVGALELATRGVLAWGSRPGARAQAAMQLDEALGWRPTPSFQRRMTRTDAAGVRHAVTIQIDREGFRRYHTNAPAGRLLVLGDSFTWAVDAGDEHAFYAHLHRDLNLEVHAFGCGGYGTLQLYLALDQYLDAIQPTAVLLQFCRNDFINNSYDLEVRSTENNNGLRRPYLQPDGRIAHAFPGGFPRAFPGLRDFANRHSRFLYWCFSRVDRGLAGRGDSIEQRFARGEKDAVFHYLNAVAITTLACKKIRERVPATVPVVAFATDDIPPFDDLFAAICADAGITWIPGVERAIAAAAQRGEPVHADDLGHWNPRGHAIAAGVIAPVLREKLTLPFTPGAQSGIVLDGGAE